ncbi:MAG: ATP-dependent DNA helicase RecQ [Akkermansiaceae bacterium]
MLKRHFGHDALRLGQDDVIDRVLDAVNTLAVLPTGGGKSLCYQLPALMLDGLTLVISPLIALMRDQVKALEKKDIPAARIDSTTDEEDFEPIVQRIRAGELKLLYMSPERIAEPSMLALLREQKISLVAIDEAHCISEWGHSFRPSYIRLPKVVRRLKPEVVLALTATASPKAASGIRKAFGILKRDQIQTSFYRENLSFGVHAIEAKEKKNFLLGLLSRADATPAIVYATRRGDVEEIASYLNKHGIAARAYHAGMPAGARAEVQDGFLQHRFPVICATIAFGMGVDMPDVRSVIHYHPPKSPEGWVQESGRAGRDGKPSRCEILINKNDQEILQSMTIAKQPSKNAIQAILRNIFSQGARAVVSRYNLSTLQDVPIELLDILLARLETGGWITPDGGSWMWCHLVPLRWDADARSRILHGFAKKNHAMLGELIDSRQRVSLFDLADGKITKLNSLIKLLRELEAAGDVRLKLSHSLVHYRVKKSPESLSDLSDEMLLVFQQHEEHDLGRINEVFKMATSRKCIAVSLVGYFGEKLTEPCGSCASCCGKKRPRKLPAAQVEEISAEEIELIQTLVRENRAALSSPERLARLLCGIYSPAMLRYRLYQNDCWGLLERLPFLDVLAYTRSLPWSAGL